MVSLADLPVDGKETMVIAMEALPQYRNVSAEARVGLRQPGRLDGRGGTP